MLHQRLNIDRIPIVNKYREGKMKRTLEREFKEPEITGMEAVYDMMNSSSIWIRIEPYEDVRFRGNRGSTCNKNNLWVMNKL